MQGSEKIFGSSSCMCSVPGTVLLFKMLLLLTYVFKRPEPKHKDEQGYKLECRQLLCTRRSGRFVDMYP